MHLIVTFYLMAKSILFAVIACVCPRRGHMCCRDHHKFCSKCLYVCGDRRGTRLALRALYFFPSEYFDDSIELATFYFSPSSPLVPVIPPFLLRKHHLWFLKAHFLWLFCFSFFLLPRDMRPAHLADLLGALPSSFGENARSASSCLSCSAHAPALSHSGEWAL